MVIMSLIRGYHFSIQTDVLGTQKNGRNIELSC